MWSERLDVADSSSRPPKSGVDCSANVLRERCSTAGNLFDALKIAASRASSSLCTVRDSRVSRNARTYGFRPNAKTSATAVIAPPHNKARRSRGDSAFERERITPAPGSEQAALVALSRQTARQDCHPVAAGEPVRWNEQP